MKKILIFFLLLFSLHANAANLFTVTVNDTIVKKIDGIRGQLNTLINEMVSLKRAVGTSPKTFAYALSGTGMTITAVVMFARYLQEIDAKSEKKERQTIIERIRRPLATLALFFGGIFLIHMSDRL